MRAILSAYKNDQPVMVGTEGRIITKEYKSFAMLYRYAIIPALKQHDGRLRAEIYNNWERRYYAPDKVMTWNSHIFSKVF